MQKQILIEYNLNHDFEGYYRFNYLMCGFNFNKMKKPPWEKIRGKI